MARTRPIKRFKAGTTIFFRIELRNGQDDTMPLFASASVPTIIIRGPDGVIAADYLGMTAGDTGIYTYTHQTTTASTIGVWQVGFKAVSGGLTVYTPETDGFELVP